MGATELSYLDGDQLTPAFDHARVRDAMRDGVFTCSADTPLAGVARIMTTRHVHSVVVTGLAVDERGRIGRRPWGVVTDVDLIGAARDADGRAAADIASLEVIVVTPDTPLADAAAIMHDYRISHLVVVDPDSGEPVGMLSGLDVAGNIASARG